MSKTFRPEDMPKKSGAKSALEISSFVRNKRETKAKSPNKSSAFWIAKRKAQAKKRSAIKRRRPGKDWWLSYSRPVIFLQGNEQRPREGNLSGIDVLRVRVSFGKLLLLLRSVASLKLSSSATGVAERKPGSKSLRNIWEQTVAKRVKQSRNTFRGEIPTQARNKARLRKRIRAREFKPVELRKAKRPSSKFKPIDF